MFGSKIRTLLISLGWKEYSLKIDDWDPVELSGKAAMNFHEIAAAPKIFSLLNRSSCWKVVVLYYRRNVQDKWAFCGYGNQLAVLWRLNLAFAYMYLFLVCDTWWLITTPKTIPFSKTITIILVSFLKILLLVFKSLNNLSPSYLADRLSYQSHSTVLQSASKQLLDQPQSITKT